MADRPGLRIPGRGVAARRLVALAALLERRARGPQDGPGLVADPGATLGPDVIVAHGGSTATAPAVVAEGAWVARGARLLPGVEIGAGAVVLPYSVVHHDVPAGAIVQGNPAVVIGRRDGAGGASSEER